MNNWYAKTRAISDRWVSRNAIDWDQLAKDVLEMWVEDFVSALNAGHIQPMDF